MIAISAWCPAECQEYDSVLNCSGAGSELIPALDPFRALCEQKNIEAMKWTSEAEDRISKVPFFVRRKVRKEVEKEARAGGASVVDVGHIESCRKRYMTDRQDQTAGFEVDQCFGADKCPNRAVDFGDLYSRIHQVLEPFKLGRFLRKRVNGPLKMHHAFRVSVSGCPNCCSRPQIVDFGLAGASVVQVTENECSECGACYEKCRESALSRDKDNGRPVMDASRCLGCGECAAVCPSGTLEVVTRGFRVMLGGKLGRHPRLATELEGVRSHDQVLELLKTVIRHYKEHNRGGERLGDILERTGFEFLGSEKRR